VYVKYHQSLRIVLKASLLPALFAALLDNRISRLALDGMLVSYEAVVSERMNQGIVDQTRAFLDPMLGRAPVRCLLNLPHRKEQSEISRNRVLSRLLGPPRDPARDSSLHRSGQNS
jgi:hypothetical protein